MQQSDTDWRSLVETSDPSAAYEEDGDLGDGDHSHDINDGGHARRPVSSSWSQKALNPSPEAYAPTHNRSRPRTDPSGRQTLDDFVGSMIDSDTWRESVLRWF